VQEPAIPVVQAPTELVEDALPALDALAGPHLAARGPGLVVDLGGTDFLGSLGMGWLVRLGKALAEEGRVLALARPRRAVLLLLRTVGLDAVIPPFPTVAQACDHVRRRAAPAA
jgi:anti-anti-sigma factor